MEKTEATTFQTTRWSMVRRAVDEGDPQAAEALAQLCQLYWRPLFVYCYGNGRSRADAEDLTQGYFTQLLARDSLRLADPRRGKFRTFLLASFKNYLTDVHRQGQAAKRGRGATHVPFDLDLSEGCLIEHATEAEPERAYDRQWARDLVQRATTCLREEYKAGGKGEWFENVAGENAGACSYQELAARFGSTEDAVKSFALRVRKRFRMLLEREIADTVASPHEMQSEMAYLAELLRG